MRRHYCKNENSNQKNFVSCGTCGLCLCLTKERNYFGGNIYSFQSRLNCLLYTFLEISCFCVDSLVYFYHQYRVLYVIEYAYLF